MISDMSTYQLRSMYHIQKIIHLGGGDLEIELPFYDELRNCQYSVSITLSEVHKGLLPMIDASRSFIIDRIAQLKDSNLKDRALSYLWTQCNTPLDMDILLLDKACSAFFNVCDNLINF